MKLFDQKRKKYYKRIQDLISQNENVSIKLNKKPQIDKIDEMFNFYHNGQSISANKVKNLLNEKNKESTSNSTIIVSQKYILKQNSNIHQQIPPSYDKYRQTIQNFIKNAKISQKAKQKINQNAQFLFQRSIDGNFKYHAFQFLQYEQQFTEGRKKQLIDKVFIDICNRKQDTIKMVEKKIKKDQIQQQNINDEQKPLQLYQIEYITQNWKYLISLNKQLLKINLDNDLYQPQKQKNINQNSNQIQQEFIYNEQNKQLDEDIII